MKFSRKVQLIEQLINRVAEITDDEAIDSLQEELLDMKKQEVLELVELAYGDSFDGVVLTEENCKAICWFGYLAGELQ